MKKDIENKIASLEEFIRNSALKTDRRIVSKEVLYSYRHANRLFTALKGESIQSYSKKIRLTMAAEYLKYSSNTIFDIAIDCGYESTSAFCKAFKIHYGLTPTAFRQQKNIVDSLKNEKLSYDILFFDDLEINIFKISMPSDIDFKGYYQCTKTAINELQASAKEWMLLWDEDPKLTQVSESIYFVGLNSDAFEQSGITYKSNVLNGRYAIFNADSLKEYSYDYWHECIYAFLRTGNIKLRKSSYIEYFSNTALNSLHTFLPYKIAIPIQ